MIIRVNPRRRLTHAGLEFEFQIRKFPLKRSIDHRAFVASARHFAQTAGIVGLNTEEHRLSKIRKFSSAEHREKADQSKLLRPIAEIMRDLYSGRLEDELQASRGFWREKTRIKPIWDIGSVVLAGVVVPVVCQAVLKLWGL